MCLCFPVQPKHYYKSGGKSKTRWRKFALLASAALAMAALLQTASRYLFFYPLRITTDSMQPEIRSGDKRYFIYPQWKQPTRGDVVLVRLVQAEAEILCRIVATDGDTVEIQSGELRINRDPVKKLAYAVATPADPSYHLAETEIRPGFFFCLNDNDRNRNDSRLHGSFARSAIVAVLFRPPFFF